MRLKGTPFAFILSIVFEGHQAPLITCPSPSLQHVLVVAASRCGAVFQQLGQTDWSGLKERWIYLMSWSRPARISDWAEGSHPSKTMTLNTQDDTRGSLWQPWMNPIKHLWRDLRMVTSNLTGLRGSAEKNGRINFSPDVKSLWLLKVPQRSTD